MQATIERDDSTEPTTTLNRFADVMLWGDANILNPDSRAGAPEEYRWSAWRGGFSFSTKHY